MDFFSAGGFQQLFSDLDEQLEMPAETIAHSMQEINETTNLYHKDRSLAEAYNSSSDSSISNDFYQPSCQYANLNTIDEQSKDAQMWTLQTAEVTSNNNSTTAIENLNQQLEHCLDYLLPTNDEIYYNLEFTEWEAQFLDNYIEIPELIDFLPEKTPLCTDTCELFLQESSKNLRLFCKAPQKVRKCKSAAVITTADLAHLKGYPCNFGSCEKIYAKPAHLKAHLRRHMGEKPYICTWPDCTWKFSRSDELARHRRSHSGVKPYKCDFCTKCFARSDHLAKHRKVHERRLLAVSNAGGSAGDIPSSVFNVRPGRKRKNQVC